MSGLLPDEIVCNIFARLPAKALLRFRCLSKYWNHVVREPYFMNLRSRRIIIIPIRKSLRLIDDNVPIEDMSHSILECPYPLDKNKNPPFRSGLVVAVIGTINGIVLIANLHKTILYNPFTGASKTLPKPPMSTACGHSYGFGYGANPDDLKIVRFRLKTDICDVYSFKKGCWSSWSTSKYNITSIRVEGRVGKFLNGFLHWGITGRNVLIVLNVKNMVLSEIRLPSEDMLINNPLGDIDGFLCSLHRTNFTIFNMWVMKEYGDENSWRKLYSFTLPAVDATWSKIHFIIAILDSGKILMMDPFEQLIIYDPSKDSSKMLNISLHDVSFMKLHGLEYVESLVSPSDICFEEKKREEKEESI